MTTQEPGGEYTRSDIIRMKMIAEMCSGTVLDIGCGTREIEKYLPEGCTYSGFDTCPGNREYYGDVYEMPLNKKFDTVLLLEVLEHLEKPFHALSDIHEICKEKLIISVPNPYNLDQIASVIHNDRNIINSNHLAMYGKNEIEALCFCAGFHYVGEHKFYTKIPGLNWLSPIKSRFGEWSIYEVLP